MTTLESIDRMTLYYQEFHHKCVTWYVTIMGFFVAGAIAAPTLASQLTSRLTGMVLLVASLVFAFLFVRCFAHYGARIKLLTSYLDGVATPIPEDWRSAHKNVGWEIHGVGSHFFLSVVLAMQVIHIFLVLIRFF
jgi:hypothetical protein